MPQTGTRRIRMMRCQPLGVVSPASAVYLPEGRLLGYGSMNGNTDMVIEVSSKDVYAICYTNDFAAGNDPMDYEQKYKEDPIYKEVDPNARVWRTYLDESQTFDSDMTEDARDTVDVLLVFVSRSTDAYHVDLTDRLFRLVFSPQWSLHFS